MTEVGTFYYYIYSRLEIRISELRLCLELKVTTGLFIIQVLAENSCTIPSFYPGKELPQPNKFEEETGVQI